MRLVYAPVAEPPATELPSDHLITYLEAKQKRLVN
jgi:hypothetical protein